MGDHDAPVDLVRIWNAKVNQDEAALRDLDPFVVHNVVYCLAQVGSFPRLKTHRRLQNSKPWTTAAANRQSNWMARSHIIIHLSTRMS